MLDIMPGSNHNENDVNNDSQVFGMKIINNNKNSNNSNNNQTYPNAPKNLMQESDNLDWIEDKQDTSKMLFIFTSVVLIIALGFWTYLYFTNNKKMSEFATLDVQFDELQNRLNQPNMILIDQAATRLSGGLVTLNQLVSNQALYSKFFTELNKRIPGNTILQNISIDEKNVVTISANSSSLEDSAVFVKSIKEITFLNNVILNADTQTQIGNEKLYNISLTANLNPALLVVNSEEVQ